MVKIRNNIKTTIDKLPLKIMGIFRNNQGQGAIDTAIIVMTSVVIGALLLAGLYRLFGHTVLPTLTRKIQEMFNFRGWFKKGGMLGWIQLV